MDIIVHGVAKSQTQLSLWNNNGGLWRQKTLILRPKFELCFSHSLAMQPWKRKWQPTPAFLPGRIQGKGEPGGLPSMGSHRVEHD